jgi:hypothetical protein
MSCSTSRSVRYSRGRSWALGGRRGVTVRFTAVDGLAAALEFSMANALYAKATVRMPDLAWRCSPCISPQCRLDPLQPSSSPSAFPSFGMPLFMQYVATKLLLNYLARPGRLLKGDGVPRQAARGLFWLILVKDRRKLSLRKLARFRSDRIPEFWHLPFYSAPVSAAVASLGFCPILRTWLARSWSPAVPPVDVPPGIRTVSDQETGPLCRPPGRRSAVRLGSNGGGVFLTCRQREGLAGR